MKKDDNKWLLYADMILGMFVLLLFAEFVREKYLVVVDGAMFLGTGFFMLSFCFLPVIFILFILHLQAANDGEAGFKHWLALTITSITWAVFTLFYYFSK